MKLVLINSKSGDMIEIDDHLTIGRKEGDKIISSDSTLSKRHCKLKITDGDLFIKDLGASNPIIINSKKVKPNTYINIKLNDKVIIGSHLFVVEEFREFDSTQIVNLSDLKENLEQSTITDYFIEFYMRSRSFLIINLVGCLFFVFISFVALQFAPTSLLLRQVAESVIIWNFCLFLFFLMYKKVIQGLVKLKSLQVALGVFGVTATLIVASMIATLTLSDYERAMHVTNKTAHFCSSKNLKIKSISCYRSLKFINTDLSKAQIKVFGVAINNLSEVKKTNLAKRISHLYRQKKYGDISRLLNKALSPKSKKDKSPSN